MWWGWEQTIRAGIHATALHRHLCVNHVIYIFTSFILWYGGRGLNLGPPECWTSVYHLVISSFPYSQNGLRLTSQLRQALTMPRLQICTTRFFCVALAALEFIL